MLEIMTMHSEAGWSLLSPNPIIKYLPEFNEHIVYWCGIGMLHSTALTLACHHMANIYPGASVKAALYDKFLKLYNAGAFQTSDWDTLANQGYATHYDLISSWLKNKGGTAPGPDRDLIQVLSMLKLNQSV